MHGITFGRVDQYLAIFWKETLQTDYNRGIRAELLDLSILRSPK
jgi:pyruvate-formate lyase